MGIGKIASGRDPEVFRHLRPMQPRQCCVAENTFVVWAPVPHMSLRTAPPVWPPTSPRAATSLDAHDTGRENAMLNLTQDQRGLLDYLADRVRELITAAGESVGDAASNLIAEAEELTAIRAHIVNRTRVPEQELQMQLPLELKDAA